MKEVPVAQIACLIAERMAKGGVFLSTAAGGRQNVMTLGWGGLTRFFGADCFIAPVRTSRFTYGLLRQNGSFTISIPLHDMKDHLMLAGTKSGRDLDKFAALNLTPAPAQAVLAPIVAECELHMECESLGFASLSTEGLTTLVTGRWYPTHDPHTLFMGKVVRCYYTA